MTHQLDVQYDLCRLSKYQMDLCNKTISPYTFYMIVGDALSRGKALSVVRMGDGEVSLMNACRKGNPDSLVTEMADKWQVNLGIKGITKGELERRLTEAANSCTHFAPSITGIQRETYDLYGFFPWRGRYVDNFFVNAWDDQMKANLFKKAGHVLLIHGNPHTADSMQLRVQANLGVKVSYLKLTNWDQADSVIEKAVHISAPLVLFSAGPASKYIGPKIAHTGKIPKVTLDIGNAADYWTFKSLPANREAADKFYFDWIKKHPKETSK